MKAARYGHVIVFFEKMKVSCTCNTARLKYIANTIYNFFVLLSSILLSVRSVNGLDDQIHRYVTSANVYSKPARVRRAIRRNRHFVCCPSWRVLLSNLHLHFLFLPTAYFQKCLLQGLINLRNPIVSAESSDSATYANLSRVSATEPSKAVRWRLGARQSTRQSRRQGSACTSRTIKWSRAQLQAPRLKFAL